MIYSEVERKEIERVYGVFKEFFVRNVIHVIAFDGAEHIGKKPDVFGGKRNRAAFFRIG